jgi:hypothetical protein
MTDHKRRKAEGLALYNFEVSRDILYQYKHACKLRMIPMRNPIIKAMLRTIKETKQGAAND